MVETECRNGGRHRRIIEKAGGSAVTQCRNENLKSKLFGRTGLEHTRHCLRKAKPAVAVLLGRKPRLNTNYHELHPLTHLIFLLTPESIYHYNADSLKWDLMGNAKSILTIQLHGVLSPVTNNFNIQEAMFGPKCLELYVQGNILFSMKEKLHVHTQ